MEVTRHQTGLRTFGISPLHSLPLLLLLRAHSRHHHHENLYFDTVCNILLIGLAGAF